MTDTDENIFLARVAEQAERFEDMVDFLGKVLDAKAGDVSADERNLQSPDWQYCDQQYALLAD